MKVNLIVDTMKYTENKEFYNQRRLIVGKHTNNHVKESFSEVLKRENSKLS